MTKQQRLAAIKNYIGKMPSLPTTVTKILEICNDPQTSPSDLNRIISVDPVLMGKVMKLINSAYYGLTQKVTSLVRAIIMLGINTVKNLALSTAVLGSLGSKKNFQAMNMDGFWRHSLCVGVTSKLIAKMRKVDSKSLEEYFIAGLLHDIGKIPLNNKLANDYVVAMHISDTEHIPLYQAEKSSLSINHSEVGHLIVVSWQLSHEVRDAVTYHHKVSDYAGKHKDFVYTIALANAFSNMNEIGYSGDRFPEPLDPKVYEYLGVTLEDLDEIEDLVNGEIENASIFLKLAQQ
ncbi:MAG: HDOD domain-containing protein [Spirochaetales bacterium]|nr:HDOD domain-containing protein [Spirochaetales bacterium]